MSPLLVLICAGLLLLIISVTAWRRKMFDYQGTRMSLLLLTAILCSGLLALLPGQGLGEKALRNVDVIFMVDATYSMNALDGRGGASRLANAKEDIKKITSSVGGSIAIVHIGQQPYVYLPLTDSRPDIDLAVDSLITPGAYDNRGGSEFAAGFETAAAYVNRSQQLNPDRKKILVFMTDGERRGQSDTDASIAGGIQKLKPLLASSLVVGYGEQEAVSLPVVDIDPNTGTLKQYNFTITDPLTERTAATKRDDVSLKQLSTELNAELVMATNQSAIESEIAGRLAGSLVSESGRLVETNRQANPAYLLPIATALFLVILVEFGGLRVPLLSERREEKK